MDRLTREEVEGTRTYFSAYPGDVAPAKVVIQLCDLALSALSQEAVRDEALEKTRYELARGLLQRFGKIGQMETAVKIVDFVLDKEGKWKD